LLRHFKFRYADYRKDVVGENTNNASRGSSEGSESADNNVANRIILTRASVENTNNGTDK
jgi:hypothetical protein